MSNSSASNKKVLINVFIVFIALLISLIPWESVRYADYYDRVNYINYIDNNLNKIFWFDFSGFFSKLTNEWLWHYLLNFFNSEVGLSSSPIIWFISFLFLLISFFCVRYYSGWFAIFFILNPIFIDFFYSQLRLTFAMSFLYLSILLVSKNRLIGFLILIPGFFIHTSIFLFVFIFYSAYFISINNYLSKYSKVFLSILIGLFVSLLTGPYMSVILTSLEDRRAEYNDMSSPFVYMSFWIFFIFYLIFKMIKYNYNNYYYYIALSILTMVFLNNFISGYSSRFLAACMPFIIISLLNLKGKESIFIFLGYIMYFIMLWFFWIT